jgi:flagellar motor protein MotB
MRSVGLQRSLGWILLAAAGCAQNPFGAGQAASQPPNMALAQQAQEFQSRAALLDRSNQELETLLAQSRQQERLLQDQVSALRDQLASTSQQLAIARESKSQAEQRAEAALASTRRRAGAAITANSSLRERLPAINLPDVEVRQDGDVIRIELPADRLFTPGTAQLRPDAFNLLSAVATEIENAYSGQIIGVEGHNDNDPVPSGGWMSPHQFSMARATAVFDFLSTRTRLRPGQLFLVGHGANHPVVSNATPAGKARNRRVELVIYPERPGG